MRQVIVLSVLLAAALVGSYATWTGAVGAEEAATDKVAMFRASAGEVSKITWSSDDVTLVAEKRKDDKGEYTWVTVTETIEKVLPPPPPDGDTDSTNDPKPEVIKEEKITVFLGNEAAVKLWTSFSPLQAMRELEATSAAPAAPAEGSAPAAPAAGSVPVGNAAFGLDTPKAKMTLVKGAETLEMSVGGETWGTKDRYVGFGGKVYLVDDADLRPVQYGKSRLMEKKVQPLAEPDLREVKVDADGASAAWTRRNPDDKANTFWARAGSDARDVVGDAWIDKLIKVQVLSYEDAAAVPVGLVSVAKVTVKGKTDADLWTVEILKTDAASPDYYARSDYSRATVKLNRTLAEAAVADLKAVIAGDAAAPAAPAGGPGPAPAGGPGPAPAGGPGPALAPPGDPSAPAGGAVRP